MADRVVSKIRKMPGLWKFRDRNKDRVISGIQERQSTLGRLSRRSVVQVALLSLETHAFCPEEIETAAIDGVEFTVLPDFAEVLGSNAVFDVILLCCHVRGEESI